jgi:hypothetical protein
MKKELILPVLASHALFLCAGCSIKKNASNILQETDDRITTTTSLLVNVTPVLEECVNRGIDEARRQLKISSDAATTEEKLEIVKRVGENIGAYVKGSGITPLDIVQLTNLEIELENMLSEKRLEKARVPFSESRYRENPVGIPYISGSTPANLNTKTANHTIATVFNFSGTLVGADKLAHVFAVGRKMFLANLTPSDAWKLSQFLEGHPNFPKTEIPRFAAMGFRIDAAWALFGVYGSLPTGVISEADMHANMHGIRFYEKLFAAPASYKFELAKLCDGEKPCQWFWNEQNIPNLFTKAIRINDTEK